MGSSAESGAGRPAHGQRCVHNAPPAALAHAVMGPSSMPLAVALGLLGLLVCGLTVPGAAGDLRACEQEFVRVVDTLRPCVVTVIAYSSMDASAIAPGQNAAHELKKNVGSGVIIDGDGHVLTTTSIVGWSRNLFIRTADGGERPAVFLGADHVNGLVLLKVKAEGLKPAPIGQPERLETGALAIIVGESSGDFPNYAFGAFTVVASSGAEPCLLHMTTQLYPGNTGGAVASTEGRVVGIVIGAMSGVPAARAVRGASAAPNAPSPATVSVAIPIDRAQEVAAQIAEHGTAAAGFLGVRVRTPAPALKDLLNFEDGVLILDVLGGSPAAAAGIEAGDVILSFGGTSVREQAELVRLVAQARPGTRCTVELLRGDLRLTRDVTVGAAPPGPESARQNEDAEREMILERIEELRQEIEGLEARLRSGSGS